MATAQLALPSAEPGRDERPADPTVAVYGAVVFGVAALVAMGALLAAWLIIAQGTAVWPPKGAGHQDYFGVTLSITTAIAAIGGWWGMYGVMHGERRQASLGFTLAAFMHLAFLNLQSYVIRQSGVSPRQGAFGVLYYGLNVTVAVIVVTGLAAALVALFRVLGGHVTQRQPGVALAAAWYGLVVAAAWLAMFATVYIIS